MNETVIELDVREDIKEKNDPFHKIMHTIKDFVHGDTLVLHAPFKPEPLLKVLKGKGFDYNTEEISPDHWRVIFTKTA